MTKLEFDYMPGEEYSSGAIFPDDYVNFDSKPSFWKNLNYYLLDMKSKAEAIDYMLHRGEQTPKTVKACPAMTAYFKKTIPVKFTTDVIIETFNDGRYSYRCFDQSMNIREHGPSQVGGHLRNDFIIIKFFFNVLIKLKSNSFSFSSPILHNAMPYEVVPGIIENQKWPIDLNINSLFPKINCKYHFKAGDVCAVILLEKPVTDIVHNENLYKEWKRSGYLKYKSIFDSTKNLV